MEIHLDPAATRARGLGEALATQGALNMTWFTEAAARFAGGWERLLDFNVRFLDNVYAGERVECTGTVTAVDANKGEAWDGWWKRSGAWVMTIVAREASRPPIVLCSR